EGYNKYSICFASEVQHIQPATVLGSVHGSKLYALCFVATPLPVPPPQGGREPCGAHLRNSLNAPAALPEICACPSAFAGTNGECCCARIHISVDERRVALSKAHHDKTKSAPVCCAGPGGSPSFLSSVSLEIEGDGAPTRRMARIAPGG